jgi:hypothetical protein
MLRQICRHGRLMGFIHAYALSDNIMGKALQVLVPQSLLDQEIAVEPTISLTKIKILPPEVYEAILAYINAHSPFMPFHHFKHFPHPLDANVLPRIATPLNHVKHKGWDYSILTMHAGNSSIRFQCQDGTTDLGLINSIWSQTLQDKTYIFLTVAPHARLTAEDEAKNPYLSRPGFLATLIYSKPLLPQKLVVIRLDDIVSHVAYYQRPPGTFAIGSATTVVIDSLHRGRD